MKNLFDICLIRNYYVMQPNKIYHVNMDVRTNHGLKASLLNTLTFSNSFMNNVNWNLDTICTNDWNVLNYKLPLTKSCYISPNFFVYRIN